MDLWIRSQDKKHFLKVNHIELNKTAIITRENDVILLGIYSEERALKVLEQIQNIIKPKANAMLSREAMKSIQDDYDMTVLPSCVDVIEPKRMNDNIRINLLTHEISEKDKQIDKFEKALSDIKVLIERGIVENEIKGYSAINLDETCKYDSEYDYRVDVEIIYKLTNANLIEMMQ